MSQTASQPNQRAQAFGVTYQSPESDHYGCGRATCAGGSPGCSEDGPPRK
jgi:hypothetical protein